MKIVRIALTVLTIAGITGLFAFRLYNNKQKINEKAQPREEVITAIPVRVAQVEKLPIDNSLNLTGSFEARQELNIIAEAQGRLTSLRIEEGAAVQKGQAVAKIDDTGIRSQLATAQASMEKSKKDVERYERLVKAGAVSQQQLEEMKLNLQNMETNVTAVEQQLKYTTVKSPMTGIVKEVKVEEGSFATPGATIATVVDISRLKMVVKVPETDIVKVKKGQQVEIKTDVYPDKVFTGKISLISVQADQGRKFDVEIELPNDKQFPLKAGMYGSVLIQPAYGKTEYALFVPRNALTGSVKDAKVYVLQPDSTVVLRKLQVGEDNEGQVPVLEGLSEGETVIITGQINLSDGKKVKIIGNELTAAKQ
ncbi:MAG: efflux RND transporter periplasmic adaptor subunit [Phaeodactylibacter sp.]|nr:efflux RND transporter periplasmic adaptor subunit [Phaeodactylibacter sp.]MCB9303157.1 efflux RND transporter periplasmic adaptor subunit [Lewinellaceae bacterium]HQU58207.1 efflux RND transporter periplasmic adaptor subunit [Saprospiraceae bacterium]